MTRLYRKGDVVSVRCVIAVDQTPDEVNDVSDPHVRVAMPNQFDRAYLPVSAVELLIPHFNVDDSVSSGGKIGKVFAKNGNALWVRLDDTGSFETWSAIDTDLAENGGAQ